MNTRMAPSMRQSLMWALLVMATFGMAQQPAALTPDLHHTLAQALTLVGPADAPPAALRIQSGDKVSFMGDSITDMGGYLRIAALVLNTNYPNLKLPTFVNAGRGGNKAEDMEPRFSKDMRLSEGTRWAFISVGINDTWHRSPAQFDQTVLDAYRSNVQKMVDSAQAAGATVVLLTPTVIYEKVDSEANIRLQRLVVILQQIATEKHCMLVDLHGMFLTAIAKKPADLPLTIDNVHMSPFGDAIMAIGVLRAFGVPDTVIAGADTISLLHWRKPRMPLQAAADLLGTTPERFGHTAFVCVLAF